MTTAIHPFVPRETRSGRQKPECRVCGAWANASQHDVGALLRASLAALPRRGTRIRPLCASEGCTRVAYVGGKCRKCAGGSQVLTTSLPTVVATAVQETAEREGVTTSMWLRRLVERELSAPLTAADLGTGVE